MHENWISVLNNQIMHTFRWTWKIKNKNLSVWFLSFSYFGFLSYHVAFDPFSYFGSLSLISLFFFFLNNFILFFMGVKSRMGISRETRLDFVVPSSNVIPFLHMPYVFITKRLLYIFYYTKAILSR